MHRNEVVLVGRLSMEPAEKCLPSGALVTQWRLAVRRPVDHPGYQRADAIECVTFDDDIRLAVRDWSVDDVVEVRGALRRRWWRGGSRCEIEVAVARGMDTSSPPEDPPPVPSEQDQDGSAPDALPQEAGEAEIEALTTEAGSP